MFSPPNGCWRERMCTPRDLLLFEISVSAVSLMVSACALMVAISVTNDVYSVGRLFDLAMGNLRVSISYEIIADEATCMGGDYVMLRNKFVFTV